MTLYFRIACAWTGYACGAGFEARASEFARIRVVESPVPPQSKEPAAKGDRRRYKGKGCGRRDAMGTSRLLAWLVGSSREHARPVWCLITADAGSLRVGQALRVVHRGAGRQLRG